MGTQGILGLRDLPTHGMPEQELIGSIVEIEDRQPRDGGLFYCKVRFQARSGAKYRVFGYFHPSDLDAGELKVVGTLSRKRSGRRGYTSVFIARRVWRGPFPASDSPSAAAIRSFLSSEAIRIGVGPKRAANLENELGDELWPALLGRPDALAPHVGGEKRARALMDAIQDIGADRVHSLSELLHLGLTLTKAELALDTLGSDAVDQVKANPYSLLRAPGIGFRTADAIAQDVFGVQPDDPRRQAAVVVDALGDAAGDGHTGLASQDLLRAVVQRLGDKEKASRAIAHALSQGQIKDRDGFLQLPGLDFREDHAALLTAEVTSRPRNAFVDERELASALASTQFDHLSPEQREALYTLFVSPMSVVLGRAGTGKTEVIESAVRLGEQLGVPVHICATTGLAGQVIDDRIGDPERPPAKTLDALVGKRKKPRRLPQGIHLVDESPMTSLDLYDRTVSRVAEQKDEVAVGWIGDPTQLESVSPGAVARDLVESSHVPTVTLTENFREATNSLGALNQALVSHGQMPVFAGERSQASVRRKATRVGHPLKGDVEENAYWLDCSEPDRYLDLLQKSVRRWIERGVDKEEILVFAPVHDGPLGTISVNRSLQEVVNPEGEPLVDHQGDPLCDARGNEIRTGDRVALTTSAPEDGLRNGMRGELVGRGPAGALLVRFDRDGEVRTISGRAKSGLTLAYARTIHAAQGSEADVAILLLHEGHHHTSLQRTLMRVAFSRHRKHFVGIGSRRALAMALKRNTSRQTRLKQRIHDHYLQTLASSTRRGPPRQTGALSHLPNPELP